MSPLPASDRGQYFDAPQLQATRSSGAHFAATSIASDWQRSFPSAKISLLLVGE